MREFPVIDMAGALRLTRQGRLREAVAALRGRPFEAAPTAGARFEPHSFASEAGRRRYKLFVPGGTGQPRPLLVMLHGCTQSPDDFAAGTRMNALAAEAGVLVAYPEQARYANVSKCWNWFSAGNQLRDRGEASLLAGITREVMRRHRVVPGRVFVAGLSAGGAAAAILGAIYPELYAAIGVHSGLACGAAGDLASGLAAMQHGGGFTASSRPIPAIVFHGDLDATVNIANAGQVIAQARGGERLVEKTIEGEAGGRRYTRRVASRPDGAARLEEWVLHGAGHAWSGGSPAGSYTDPAGPDASREMLRFFLQLRG